jgi:protein-disulfide isomerase
VRLNRACLVLALLPAALLLVAPAARAQFGAPPTTQVHDASALKPPAGAKVAIIEFEDLECPDCARANPLLKDAADKYHIPWIRHDFPLPMHNWSFQAAVNARFFDTKSQALGNEYRDSVFASQISIETPAELQQFTQRFADAHKIALPFAVDPMRKFEQEVKADFALGQKIGIEHTPTIWIVTSAAHAAPFVEVVDRSKLYQLIDEALAQARR